MPPLRKRLKLLLAGSSADAAAILAGTLPQSGPDEVDEIARAAIATGRVAAWAAVVRALDRVSGSTRRRLAEADDRRLASALTRARDGSAAVERNIVRIVALRADPAFARYAAERLADTNTGELAAQALLTLTRRALASPPGHVLRPLDEALAGVAQGPRECHHFAAVLAIAVWERRAGPALTAVLDDPETPIQRALRRLPESTDGLIRAELLRWLGRPRLASGVIRSLHLVPDGGHADVLADGHLLLAASRRRALRRAFRPLRCVPGLPEAITLPSRSQHQLVRFVTSLDLAPPTRMRILTDLVALPSPVARWRLVEALESLPARRTTPLLERLLDDRSPTVARVAARLRRVIGGERDGIVAAGRIPHVMIRRQALALRARRDPRTLAVDAGLLTIAQRRAAATCGLERARAAWIDLLVQWLNGDDVALRGEAVTLVRRHRLVRTLDATLVEAAERGGARLVSAVATALADSARPSITRILQDWLDHADPRVRANALQSLGLRDAMATHEVALPHLEDDDNRLRANAIRVVDRTDPGRAVEATRTMLTDRRALHRVSAIWAAGRMRQPCLAVDLLTMAHEDPHPEIRTRAMSAHARAASSRPRRVLEAAR